MTLNNEAVVAELDKLIAARDRAQAALRAIKGLAECGLADTEADCERHLRDILEECNETIGEAGHDQS